MQLWDAAHTPTCQMTPDQISQTPRENNNSWSGISRSSLSDGRGRPLRCPTPPSLGYRVRNRNFIKVNSHETSSNEPLRSALLCCRSSALRRTEQPLEWNVENGRVFDQICWTNLLHRDGCGRLHPDQGRQNRPQD